MHAGHKPRILIADPDPHTLRTLKAHLGSGHYTIDTARCARECLQKLEASKPALLIIELMLPQVHGIEILRRLKQDPSYREVGIILMASNVMMQDYQTALRFQCDYFLEKPLRSNTLHTVIKRFFQGTLHPAPFKGKQSVHQGKIGYTPKHQFVSSYLKFWGTRGSNPVSGSEYIRFGGNTSCLEIRHGKDLVIVDAGTGIRQLGLELTGQKQIHLLLSHTHWDHLAGFPFFAPLYDPECHITIWAPIGFEKSVHELFAEMLAYAYFPVRLDEIKAKLTFQEIEESTPFSIGSIQINTHYAHHPGSTLCFQFKAGNTTFGYATDNEFLMDYHNNPKHISAARLAPYHRMIQFFKKCDLVIHEAQYTPLEYQEKVGWGHSSISNAAILIKHAEVPQWILTHHDPKHTDLDLLKKIQLQHDIFDDYALECKTRMAFDGMMLPI